jgi:hypothetical protein
MQLPLRFILPACAAKWAALVASGMLVGLVESPLLADRGVLLLTRAVASIMLPPVLISGCLELLWRREFAAQQMARQRERSAGGGRGQQGQEGAAGADCAPAAAQAGQQPPSLAEQLMQAARRAAEQQRAGQANPLYGSLACGWHLQTVTLSVKVGGWWSQA